MQTILHRASERGVAEHGWLSSRFSFSFAEWYNPNRMGFGALRVLNDDTIATDSGFGMHPHRDMEIITIVTEGTVTHRDNVGNVGRTSAGDVQVMSAGTGVVHSEYNESSDTPLKLFQLWIMPSELHVPVRYAQQSFDFTRQGASVVPLVAPMGAATQGELEIHQAAWITYASVESEFAYRRKREANGVYIFVVEGECFVGDVRLMRRDALGLTDASTVMVTGDARILFIDVPLM